MLETRSRRAMQGLAMSQPLRESTCENDADATTLLHENPCGCPVVKVIEALPDVMLLKCVPEHLRSDNGPEFVARDLRKWLADTGAKTLYIEPGSPWENGYCESFNSKLRDEVLNGELFYSMKELRVLAERWRVHYNTVRPHSSLGYRPPAPEAWLTSTSWQL